MARMVIGKLYFSTMKEGDNEFISENYQAERQFMQHNYIRLRGRTWFLTLYGILSTLFVCAFVIYCTILLDFLIRHC